MLLLHAPKGGASYRMAAFGFGPFYFLKSKLFGDSIATSFAQLDSEHPQTAIIAMSKLLNFAKSSEAAVQTLKDSAPRWSDRTLRVVVDPTPQTFAERRSVLQALKQSGQIEVFKANPVCSTDVVDT